MKLAIVISSFNQKKRLRLCLQSALKQNLGPNATEYYIVIADDNSTDGTQEMLQKEFSDAIESSKISISENEYSEAGTYTLASNWNTAVKEKVPQDTDRLIFSNGDLIYIPNFIEAHSDPLMTEHITIGPAIRTFSYIAPFIDEEKCSYYEIMKIVSDNNWLGPDMRAGRVAHTYNQEDKPWNVYGYNFSVPKKYFDGVGGFPPKRRYGGEDVDIAKAIVKKYGCKCLTNKFATAFHLWHPPVNTLESTFRPQYNF